MGRNVYAGFDLASVPIVTGPLIDDGTGVRVGTSVFCIGRVFATAGAPTDFPHRLGRTPTTIRSALTRAGSVVYATAADRTAWSPQSIRLRCTLADTADFEVL